MTTALDASAEKPCGGSMVVMRWPSVRMMRPPPLHVPSAMAVAAATMTHARQSSAPPPLAAERRQPMTALTWGRTFGRRAGYAAAERALGDPAA